MGFLQDLTGSSARRDIRRGRDAANREITGGETQSRSDYDAGIGTLSPYETGSREGFDAYLASLGLRGPEAQQAIQGTYFNDPVQNQLMDRITRANTRRFTGVGMGNSGAATQSLTNALLANWGGYQDRLKGLGEGGMQAAGAISGLQAGKGDTSFAAAQQRAGIQTGAANATAASRSTGINNLLNIAGTAVKAATLSDRRLKENVERLGTLPSGLPVYEFSYLWSPERVVGVMADEAREIFPEAIGTRDGFLTVDYSRIG